MSGRKFQNFVKSKVHAHQGVSFSKNKPKSDSLEEPLIFDKLDLDNDFNITSKPVEPPLELNIVETDAEFVNIEGDNVSIPNPNTYDATNPLPIKSRVESIGKSVNTAFRDAQSAFSAIKETAKKKTIRKPSEIVKGRSKFKKKCVEPAVTSGGSHRSKSLSRTLEIFHDNDILSQKDKFPLENIGFQSDECDIKTDIANVDVDIKEDDKLDYDVKDTTEVIEGEIEKPPLEMINDNFKDDGRTKNAKTEEKEASDYVYLNFTSLKVVGAVGLFLAVFFSFSISKFILGLICGGLMSFGIFKIYESFYLSSTDEIIFNRKIYPKLRSYPSPLVPHIEETPVKDEFANAKASYSAWVNAVDAYHPKWNNLSLSYTLHVSLEGTKLRMKRTKNKLSRNSECVINASQFISDRMVELLHAKIQLLPYGLIGRRMWSKKYPICITLNQESSERNSDNLIHSKSLDNISEDNQTADENIFFFTRTCREKEEMFRRLIAASLGMPINLTISDIVDKYLVGESKLTGPTPLNFFSDKNDDSVDSRRSGLVITRGREPHIVSYVRYMAKFMPSDNYLFQMKSQNIKLNYVGCEPELLWLNALVGRLAWDVFRGNFWIHIIREKIEKKLKKLSLPHFIDKLEVTDIDLGTELPVIRKVSRPYLDYRGLWVEFNVVYAGGFSMGLETKINLMKFTNQPTQNTNAATSQKQPMSSSSKQNSQQQQQHQTPQQSSNIEGPSVKYVVDKSIDLSSPIAVPGSGGDAATTELFSDLIGGSLGRTDGLHGLEEYEMGLSNDNIKDEDNGRSISSPNLNMQEEGHNQYHKKILIDTSDEVQLRKDVTTGGGAIQMNVPNFNIDDMLPDDITDTDEDLDEMTEMSHTGTTPAANKSFMNWFDRFTKSSYFQKASENKYVLRTFEYVSNTTLALQVNTHYLEGTLVINIPPPPSDRLWWGFNKDVNLVIKAKPKVGQKEIQMTKIVDFIESKLLQEFQRVVVMPNMDDIPIPLLSNGDPNKYSYNLM